SGTVALRGRPVLDGVLPVAGEGSRESLSGPRAVRRTAPRQPDPAVPRVGPGATDGRAGAGGPVPPCRLAEGDDRQGRHAGPAARRDREEARPARTAQAVQALRLAD